ncbi:MAG: HlyD family efflux transporter periplasmic adaptor subunit [Burkholderiaceae bacterium]|jgi:adhesin transport system membrane fusion protein|nr:HlyD family efflux transporter periplasmic adaptor subunit [Burkholderiaceae bacterium]
MNAENPNPNNGQRVEPALMREAATVQVGTAAAAAGAGGEAPQVQVRMPQQPFSGGAGGGRGAAPPAGGGGGGGMMLGGPPKLFVGTRDEQPLPRVSWVTWLIALAFIALLAWASFFKIDEVSTGMGKVVPSLKDQDIQSLEGGILNALPVREGDIVKAGQVIAKLDPTRNESAVQESQSRLLAAEATAARLTAQVNGTKLSFPSDVEKHTNLVKTETQLYQQSTTALQKTLSDFDTQISLAQNELHMTEPLVAQGAASDVEVLRLKSRIADLQTRRNSAYNDYYVKGREDLAKANADADAQRAITQGRGDMLSRTTITSPVRGIVKDISINTVGGVIPPGGRLMSIVPLDDKLLVEARISPRDIAFIHPGESAIVKVTAYDYSIYGGLPGKVTVISPDTIQDEVRRDVYYYRVYIRTEADHLTNKLGTVFPISPGMITTVDIRTGRKTLLDYLIKPLNKGREALRER